MKDLGIDTDVTWRGNSSVMPAVYESVFEQVLAESDPATKEDVEEFIRQADTINDNDPAEQDPLQESYDIDRESDKCINCKDTMTPLVNGHTLLMRGGHSSVLKNLNEFECPTCDCIKLDVDSNTRYRERLVLLAKMAEVDGVDPGFIDEGDFDRMDW